MSSLPQGWHGVVTPPKKNGKMNSYDTASSVPIIRKKWNAPQSAEECRSKLPLYRKSSIPALPNGYLNKTTPPRRNSANLSSSQGKLSDSDQKISFRGKESQAAEIGSLKKELTTIKAENSVLKAKLRRLSDETNQKSRQMEKLRAEMQSGPINTKTKKDSESLLLLRQKCLRLEGALKDKEIALKNLVNETKSAKVEELKDLVQSYHKEIGIDNGPGSNNELKNRRSVPPQCNGKLPATKPTKSGIRDAVKGEVAKLRDMLHKLQEENKNLQQQGKEKDLEIRRLKLHMQMKIPKPAIGSQTSVASSRSTRTSVRANSDAPKRSSVPTIIPLKNKTLSSSQNLYAKPTKVPVIRPASPKRSTVQKPVKSDASTGVAQSDPTFVVTKAKSGLKPKQPMRKLRKPTYVISKPQDTDIEARVQDMRENVAARKIQRSWRHHRKQMLESEELTPEKEQALSLIQSVLRDHKARKDKLIEFASKEGTRLHLKDDEEKSIIQEVQITAKMLWS